VLGGVLAFLLASRLPSIYEARVALVAPSMGETYAELVDSPSLIQHIAARIDSPGTLSDLAANIDARASKTSALLTVTARDRDPERAARIADAVANELVQLAPTVSGSSSQAQRAIQLDLATVESLITSTETAVSATGETPTAAQRVELEALQSQLATLLSVRSSLLGLQITYSQGVVTILEPAAVPTDPVSPTPLLAAAIAGLAGMALGIGAVVALGYVNRRPS
jgi:capsular polysaccharide biosynthesis protein